MFCGVSQLNEFSVEPPAFEMEEYEEEENQSPSQSYPLMEIPELNLPSHTSRPSSNKSHSLPFKSYLFKPNLSISSDEDSYSGPSDDEDSSDLDKDEYEDMFFKSLPSDAHFQGLNWNSQNIALDSESNVDSHGKNQSECLNQTDTVQDSPPTSQSTAMEIIASNAVDQCLNEGDLSPLPVETEHLIMEKEKNDDRSIENDAEDESGSEGLGNGKLFQEENETMESTDSKDETLTCRLEAHKETHTHRHTPPTHTLGE